MRAIAVAMVVLLARGARAEPAADVLSFEAPFAFGEAGAFGDTPLTAGAMHTTARALGIGSGTTVGGHLAAQYHRGHFYVGGGAEWTLILGVGQMPQAWWTVGAAVTTPGPLLVYAGPSLRLYDLYASPDREPWSSGPRLALTAELGARVLLWSTHSHRRPGTAGLFVRANAPVAGGSGWTATIGVAAGPPIRLD